MHIKNISKHLTQAVESRNTHVNNLHKFLAGIAGSEQEYDTPTQTNTTYRLQDILHEDLSDCKFDTPYIRVHFRETGLTRPAVGLADLGNSGPVILSKNFYHKAFDALKFPLKSCHKNEIYGLGNAPIGSLGQIDLDLVLGGRALPKTRVVVVDFEDKCDIILSAKCLRKNFSEYHFDMARGWLNLTTGKLNNKKLDPVVKVKLLNENEMKRIQQTDFEKLSPDIRVETSPLMFVRTTADIKISPNSNQLVTTLKLDGTPKLLAKHRELGHTVYCRGMFSEKDLDSIDPFEGGYFKSQTLEPPAKNEQGPIFMRESMAAIPIDTYSDHSEPEIILTNNTCKRQLIRKGSIVCIGSFVKPTTIHTVRRFIEHVEKAEDTYKNDIDKTRRLFSAERVKRSPDELYEDLKQKRKWLFNSATGEPPPAFSPYDPDSTRTIDIEFENPKKIIQTKIGPEVSEPDIKILKRILQNNRDTAAPVEASMSTLPPYPVELVPDFESQLRTKTYRQRYTNQDAINFYSAISPYIEMGSWELRKTPAPNLIPTFIIPKSGKICPITGQLEVGKRLIANLKEFNRLLKPIATPVIGAEEIDATLATASGGFSTTIDLKGAFDVLKIDPKVSDLLNVVGCEGEIYKINSLPQGLMASPLGLQHAIKTVLSKMTPLKAHTKVRCFYDDIICVSEKGVSLADHFKEVEKLLQALAKAKLPIGLPKCCFGCTKVAFLGRKVNFRNNKVVTKSVSDKHLMNLQYLTCPTTICSARSFLASSSYYHQFIPYYAARSFAMRQEANEATRERRQFKVTDRVRESFKMIVNGLLKAYVCCLPSLPASEFNIQLYVDASHSGMGACLSFTLKSDSHKIPYPLRFYSKKWNDSAARASQTQNLEMQCFLESCMEFLPLLRVGAKVDAYTDSKVVFQIFNGQLSKSSPSAAIRLNYIKSLLGSNFTLSHVPTKENPSDFLSRLRLQTPLGEDPRETHVPYDQTLWYYTPNKAEQHLAGFKNMDLPQEHNTKEPSNIFLGKNPKTVFRVVTRKQAQKQITETLNDESSSNTTDSQKDLESDTEENHENSLEIGDLILHPQTGPKSNEEINQGAKFTTSINDLVRLHQDLKCPSIEAFRQILKEHHPNLKVSKNQINQVSSYCPACNTFPKHAKLIAPSSTSTPIAFQPNDILIADGASLLDTHTGCRHKNKVLFMLIDTYSRYSKAWALPNGRTSSYLKCIKEWISSYGFPRIIQWDQNSVVLGSVYQSWASQHNIATKLVEAGCHYSSSLIETTVNTVKSHLKRRYFITNDTIRTDQPTGDMDTDTCWCEWTYESTVLTNILKRPYKLEEESEQILLSPANIFLGRDIRPAKSAPLHIAENAYHLQKRYTDIHPMLIIRTRMREHEKRKNRAVKRLGDTENRIVPGDFCIIKYQKAFHNHKHFGYRDISQVVGVAGNQIHLRFPNGEAHDRIFTVHRDLVRKIEPNSVVNVTNKTGAPPCEKFLNHLNK